MYMSAEFPANTPDNQEERARQAAKLRGIASHFEEQIEALGDDEMSRRKRILFNRRRTNLLSQADFIDPANDLSEEAMTRLMDEPVYEVISWDPFTTKEVEGKAMTPQEVSEWVDNRLIEDPSLSIRLGFTDETPTIDMAIAIIFDKSTQATTD